MMENSHVTILEIDTKGLLHNLAYFKSKLNPNTKILAVVKAFAYGSDPLMMAKVLEDAGVDYFAVAYTKEGVALRKSGITKPILVLHPQIPQLQDCLNYNLEPGIYNQRGLEAILQLTRTHKKEAFPIHLKFNTGLNRIGFSEQDAMAVINKINENKELKIASIFSHLAATEDPNEQDFTLQQIEQFKNITATCLDQLAYKPIRHILNTSGIINYPEAQFDMVRSGIGLYGFGNEPQQTEQLKNVFSLKSVISQIHQIPAGASVGYNRAYIAKDAIRSATIPIGHADGISRRLGNGVGSVMIHGQKAPIIGNVCMDMIMVDISQIDCQEGDEVIVFNSQEMVNLLAEKTATISYEIITAISQRVQRLLID